MDIVLVDLRPRVLLSLGFLLMKLEVFHGQLLLMLLIEPLFNRPLPVLQGSDDPLRITVDMRVVVRRI
jgi:hypothetical protein